MLPIIMLAATAMIHPVHDWYDMSCCGGQDCSPVEGELQERDGYRMPNGELLGFTDPRIRLSHDARYHWCRTLVWPRSERPVRTLCVYVPDRGT